MGERTRLLGHRCGGRDHLDDHFPCPKYKGDGAPQLVSTTLVEAGVVKATAVWNG